MQSTSTRERSSPSSIFAGMLSPGLITHSSNHTFTPSFRNRSARARTTALSFALWLRKTSYGKSVSFMVMEETIQESPGLRQASR